jgi:photosystem II stability/assembly factor-like uncharacterized protein
MKSRLLGMLLLVAGPRLQAQEGPDHARLRWEWFYRQRAFPFAEIVPGALERARLQLGGLRASLRILGAPPIGGSRWESIGPFSINGTAIGRISTVAVHPTNSNVLYIGGAQGGVWKTINGGSTWTPLTDRQCSLAMGSIVIDPVNPEIIYAGTGEQHFSGDSYYGCGVLRSTDGGTSWTQLAPLALRVRISRVILVPSTAGSVATTTVLVATDNGLFRSTNGGTSWTAVRAGIHTDLVIDPTNEQIMYTAFRNNSGTGGIFKSTNSGVTWLSSSAGLPTSNVGRINIGMAPSAPSTLYAGVHNFSQNTLLGLYKSTDAGANWNQLSATGASCGSQCWYDLHVTVSPADPNTVFFGGVSLFRSTNGGLTFSNVTAGIHVDQHFMAFDPQNAQRVYAANDGGIYRSDNGGSTWTGINNGLAITQFYGGISLHPSNSLLVIGGTQDNGTLSYTGAPTWTSIIGGDGGFTAINHENPAVRFGETQWTANSTFSGPNRSDGAGFVRKVNGINLGDNAQFIPPLVMDPSDPRVLYFGTNKVYRTFDAAESWAAISPVFVPTSTLTAIAPAPSAPTTIYAAMSNGQVHVTTNTGMTWTQINAGLPARTATDIAVDRGDSRTAYVTFSGFGTGHVFRTVNGGTSWTNVSANLPDMPVNAVAVDPATRGFVMIGTDLGVFISSDSGSTWTILDDGMPNVAVFDIAYNPATGALVAATHGRGMFQLQLDRALTIAAVPRKRRVDVPENSTTPRPDSAAVVLSGVGGGSAQWTATHSSAAPWVTLTTASGTGSGTVRWTRNPAGRAPGFHIDTITVVSPGAIDSPARVIDTLLVEPVVPTMSVSGGAHSDTASAAVADVSTDSALVTFLGSAGAQVQWSAAARRGTWLTITTASGTGTGRVRWSRNSGGLPAGIFVDTIVVAANGVAGSPAFIIDTLVVRAALVLTPAKRDTLVSGSAQTKLSSVQLTIVGDPDGTINWTATHGAGAWLTLTTPSGRGAGTLSWTKSAANLRDGVFIDTITVSAPDTPPVRIIDTLTVVAPVTERSCVVNHLLGAACLDATQLRWLDLAGNRDGAYNLGDLLSYLARPAAGPATTPRRRNP